MADPGKAIDDQLTRASLWWKKSFLFERAVKLSFSLSKETQHKNETCHEWELYRLRSDLSTSRSVFHELQGSLTPIK
jgi:predicted acyltransferase